MAHKTQEELLAADRYSLRFPHRVWAVPGGGFQHSSWYGGVQYVRDDVHAAALAEAQATIARQQTMLDRALEDAGTKMVEIGRLREALRFYATLDGCANCLAAIYDDNFGDHARAALEAKHG